MKLRSGPWSPAATRWWMLVMYAWTVLPSSLHLPPSPGKKTRVLKRRRGRMEAFLVAAQVLLEDSGRIGIWSPKTQIIRIENVCNFFTT